MTLNHLYTQFQGHAILWRRVSQKRYDIHSFNEILIGTYTHALLNSLISNDLEWLVKIFNETKRRTVSLRQLSFLLNMTVIRHLKMHWPRSDLLTSHQCTVPWSVIWPSVVSSMYLQMTCCCKSLQWRHDVVVRCRHELIGWFDTSVGQLKEGPCVNNEYPVSANSFCPVLICSIRIQLINITLNVVVYCSEETKSESKCGSVSCL